MKVVCGWIMALALVMASPAWAQNVITGVQITIQEPGVNTGPGTATFVGYVVHPPSRVKKT